MIPSASNWHLRPVYDLTICFLRRKSYDVAGRRSFSHGNPEHVSECGKVDTGVRFGEFRKDLRERASSFAHIRSHTLSARFAIQYGDISAKGPKPSGQQLIQRISPVPSRVNLNSGLPRILKPSGTENCIVLGCSTFGTTDSSFRRGEGSCVMNGC